MHTYVVCVCANVYSMYMYVYLQMSMYPPVDLVGGGGKYNSTKILLNHSWECVLFFKGIAHWLWFKKATTK